MAFYLGIDGGGTGCRAAVADEDGRVLGTGTAGPANILSDPEGALDSILAASRQALSAAAADDVPGIASLLAGLGLAGANAAGAVARLRAALPFRRVRIDTDAVAATRGALGPDDGIVAALGTGSVFAVQRQGAIRQIGGRGLILGDEGSAAWIGRAALSRALRAVDGFTPMTRLLARLVDEYGGPGGVIAFARDARPADFGALAPGVIAAGGDAAADAILDAADAAVAEAIALLQRDGAVPVVFTGGLGPHYAARLAGRWTIAPPRGTALDGALALAREAA